MLLNLCLLVHKILYKEQVSLCSVSPESKARPASNLASKASSALASKVRAAEVRPGPHLNLSDSVTDFRLRLL
eukprot:4948852-Pleurochrysis_carterae.AAC.3